MKQTTMGEGQEKNTQQHSSHQASKHVIGGSIVIAIGVIIVEKLSWAIKQSKNCGRWPRQQQTTT